MIHILRLPGAAAIVLGLASVIYKNLFHTASFSRSCRTISSTISSQSDVYYPGASVYHTDIYHWASSSTQEPACTVEPGTAEDVGEILRILGQTRTPFAVKSGGHTANPNFSSSKGVLIALYRFNEVVYDSESQTATIGTGLIFDDVYAALEPHKVSVLGARVTGIGVGGFVLGGGYSWKTNQYGLAVDSITSFELVKPNGEVTNVTESTDSELFFGLKGGFNNFGIVTRVTMRTYPQPMVWGGMITYTKYSIAEVTAAVIKFSATNTDPKANIIAGYDCVLTEPLITQLLYYDGPNPPAGLFDDFLKIPALIKDIGQRSLHKYIKLTASNVSADFHLGAVFHTVPLLGYSARVMDTVQSELTFWCDALALDATPFISTLYLCYGEIGIMKLS
ncbi:hypothetical protein APHAL10511_005334 [Amanita phalloides]|nr:hypothetical protein APHAL10511_005334 [Amanita phalloides]